VPYGTGPNGENDGGQPCQTPASYASLNSGYSTGELGSIATNNNDNDLKVVVEGQHYRFVVDAYASIFKRSQTYQSSQYQLIPGDLNGIHTKQTHDSEAGFTVTDDLIFKNDDIQLGYYTNNYRQDELGWQFDQNHKPTGNYLFTYGNDIQSVFARLVHHSVNSPLSFYFTDYIKNSQQPNAWFNDPRVAVLYRKGNNTFRVAAGSRLPSRNSARGCKDAAISRTRSETRRPALPSRSARVTKRCPSRIVGPATQRRSSSSMRRTLRVRSSTGRTRR
jgi:hypothetical protein